jgi:hypothetical protein
MMSQNLEQQLLELPLDEQLRLVQSVLASIQQKDRVRNRTTSAILLEPAEAEIKEHLANLPPADSWLEDNLAAKASLERGLQQASQSEGRCIGSFAEFVNLDVDD